MSYSNSALKGFGYNDAALRGSGCNCGSGYTNSALAGYGYNEAALDGAGTVIRCKRVKLRKGSKEAKEYMAYLRSLRGRGGKRRRIKRMAGSGILGDVLKKIIAKVTGKSDSTTTSTEPVPDSLKNLPLGIDYNSLPDSIKNPLKQVSSAQDLDSLLAGPLGTILNKSLEFWKNTFSKNKDTRQSQKDLIEQLKAENEELAHMSPSQLAQLRKMKAMTDAIMKEYNERKNASTTTTTPTKNQLLLDYPMTDTKPVISKNPNLFVEPKPTNRRSRMRGRHGGKMTSDDWKNLFLGPYGWYQLHKTKKNQREIEALQKLRNQYLTDAVYESDFR